MFLEFPEIICPTHGKQASVPYYLNELGEKVEGCVACHAKQYPQFAMTHLIKDS